MQDSAYIGGIWCECGRILELDESEAEATPEGILYVVECGDCHEKGGVNETTLEIHGSVESIQVVGE